MLKRLVAFGFALIAMGYTVSNAHLETRVLAFGSTAPGPPIQRTGAPLEGTCTGCHYTYQPANSNPNGSVRLSGLPAFYQPGLTYAVTVTVSLQSARRWGFEVTAVDRNGSSTTVGNLALNNQITTARQTGNIAPGQDRIYISHSPGGTSPGTMGPHSWSFNWTAPQATAGDVTFYVAGNAADDGQTPEYDYIFTTLAEVKAPSAVVAATALTGLSSYFSSKGASTVDLRVYGNFDSGAKVAFNGNELQTTAMADGLAVSLPANLLAAPGVFPVRVRLASGDLTNAQSFVVANSVVTQAIATTDSAAYFRVVSPGEMATIFGTELVPGNANNAATTIPLPFKLDGTAVYVNGVAAPLYFANRLQINYQVPFEVGVGQATVVVQRSDGTVSSGWVNVVEGAPAIFTVDTSGQGQAIALNSDYTLNDPANPAKRGDYVILYGTGAGSQFVGPNGQPVVIRDGDASPQNPLAATASMPIVTIDDKAAAVYFSGLAPAFVGLWQLNIQVPPNASSGEAVSLNLSLGNQTANGVTIAVK
jgi:uncharacterized protein (TIGR03437 family)